MDKNEFVMEIQSDPEKLPEVEQFVTDIAASTSMNESIINNLALAVSEAASNCVIHGNKSDINKKVKIKVVLHPSKIEVHLKDEGAGFNTKQIPDPTKPENILKDHGRGIHIMKTFLTELKYNFTDEGTEVILIQNFN